jgi:hypothetical protein
LRAWAIEGSNGYGAGLARFLAERGEWVIELDRPSRPARRHGAKSDEIDAVRAAHEALSREHLAQPRCDGERAVLSVRLAARERRTGLCGAPDRCPLDRRTNLLDDVALMTTVARCDDLRSTRT